MNFIFFIRSGKMSDDIRQEGGQGKRQDHGIPVRSSVPYGHILQSDQRKQRLSLPFHDIKNISEMVFEFPVNRYFFFNIL